MNYQVEFTLEATDSLEKLTAAIQERMLRKIRWLAENLDNLTPQALSADLSGLFKLKVGNYRIIIPSIPLGSALRFTKLDIAEIFITNYLRRREKTGKKAVVQDRK